MPLCHHLAIDLGTTYSVAYLISNDSFLLEPTFVALKKQHHAPLAIGQEAKKMFGLTPKNIQVIQPLRDGVISDFDVCRSFLQVLIKKILNKKRGIIRNVLFCLPWGATDVEVRAYRKQLELFPFSRIFLIREPYAAALGAEIPFDNPPGNLLVDFGGGTTEITILALGGIVDCISLKIGGNIMDQAIKQEIELRHQFSIGLTTSESLKILHGSVAPVIEDYSIDIKGFHRFYRFPRQNQINSADIRMALEPATQKILQGIAMALESLSPELITDISNNGVTLVGGGALLRGWPERITKRFNLPVQIPPEPYYCVIRGMKKVLNNLKKYRPLLEE
ncbi:MAG: rod shape-determining protein [Deltaproteobacteria bacterium]|nr:rod shape-determining protein [Deltaproteobacteria bacterium]